MITKDQIRDIKARLNTITGQIDGIVKMLENDKDPDQILLQFKSAIKGLEKAELLVKDETFRKSLAEKLSETMSTCPGNCGEEDKIEMLRNQFPNLSLDQLPGKMKELDSIYDQMKKNLNKE